MLKKIAIFLILFFGFLNFSFGLYISPKIEKIYTNFTIKLEKKYSIQKEISVLKVLGKNLIEFKIKKKYENNVKFQNILNQFIELNNKKILSLKREYILSKLKEKDKKDNISKNTEIIQKQNNEEKIIKTIIDKYAFSKYFKNIIYNYDLIFLEDGVWYSYKINKYLTFPKNVNITLRDLTYNGIDVNKDLLFLTKTNEIGIVKNPKKIRLISDNIISGIINKNQLLEEIKIDILKQGGTKNYDKDFLELKNKAISMNRNLQDEYKIRNIYNYILRNFKYSLKIDFSNYRQFSGIEIFKNRSGVCEAYARFMYYMGVFSGIKDIEIIKGYVIDAKDFPQVGHAWIRIGDKYYDPTFDDPINLGAEDNKTKKYEEYIYYELPKDLFYTNRYDEKELPNQIKYLSLEERKKLIQKNLYLVSAKYKNSNYNILKSVNFRKKHNIKYDEKIDLNNFERILDKKVVHNFSFTENGTRKNIKSLKYYQMNDSNIENIIKQLDYNLDGYYFFEWYDDKGNKDYRLAYELIIR